MAKNKTAALRSVAPVRKRRPNTYRNIPAFAFVVLCVLVAYIAGPGFIERYVPPRHGHPFKIIQVPIYPKEEKGVVAFRDIKQGELILREEPLMMVQFQEGFNISSIITDAISSLDAKSLKDFYSLSRLGLPSLSAKDPDLPLLIFQTNALNFGAAGAGVFRIASRFNHGCSKAFNAVPSWRPSGGLVIHAIKPIRWGDEILIPYMDTRMTRHHRRQYLAKIYGFPCSCEVCSLADEKSALSDSRLTSLASLEKKLKGWWSGDLEPSEAVRTVKMIWNVGAKEEYWSGRGHLAEQAALIATKYSDEKAAREWATLAEEWYGFELGQDSQQARSMGLLADSPTENELWGTGEDHLRVGLPEELGLS